MAQLRTVLRASRPVVESRRSEKRRLPRHQHESRIFELIATGATPEAIAQDFAEKVCRAFPPKQGWRIELAEKRRRA